MQTAGKRLAENRRRLFLQLLHPNEVVVVVARIYPPVTGQRQTLTCWMIRTLFIARTTS